MRNLGSELARDLCACREHLGRLGREPLDLLAPKLCAQRRLFCSLLLRRDPSFLGEPLVLDASSLCSGGRLGRQYLGALLLGRQFTPEATKNRSEGQNHTTGPLFSECLRGKFGRGTKTVTAHEGDR